jgi:hypothetical protein
MAEGLRLLGACSRCGGELSFAPAGSPDERHEPPVAAVEPQHVLGVPRSR